MKPFRPSAAAAGTLALAPGAQAEKIRVAAYNIQFLNASIPNARHANLSETISAWDVDVITLDVFLINIASDHVQRVTYSGSDARSGQDLPSAT